jgi:CRISPR-associated protein Csb1
MTLDLAPLLDPHGPRKLLVEAELRPVQGARFQPTGFPDLGAAVFETSTGTRLLVESHQSMANRMEATCWDPGAQELIPELRGLSYVRVIDEKGAFLTSSILEAHRLNSAYILKGDDSSLFDALVEESKAIEGAGIDRRKLAAMIFKYDANSLLHGVFLSRKELAGGRLRVERALSAFIEAEGVRVAASGGVKNDHVDPSGADTAGAEEGFGNIPFQRDEYTADRITAFFNLDLAELRGFGLGEAATRLLVGLGLYKVRALLDGQLRLRTACDLEVVGEPRVTRPEGFRLPDADALRGALPSWVSACADRFAGEGGVTQVVFAREAPGKGKRKAKED